jgi:hypothetical protein
MYQDEKVRMGLEMGLIITHALTTVFDLLGLPIPNNLKQELIINLSLCCYI